MADVKWSYNIIQGKSYPFILVIFSHFLFWQKEIIWRSSCNNITPFPVPFYHIYVIQMDNYDERWRVPNLNVHTSSFISYGRYSKNINSQNSHFCRDKKPVIRIIGTCKRYLNTTSTQNRIWLILQWRWVTQNCVCIAFIT